MKLIRNIEKYIKYYDEHQLLGTLRIIGGKIGSQIVMYAIVMLILIRDNNVPAKVKITLMAALGYLILPTDLITDVLPVIGFTDDIAFLSYVISSTTEYITPEVKSKARKKMAVWIKNDTEEAEVIEYSEFEK
jgi:uncharacterized membrane protein YkvA (DUF1232 family)